MLSVFPRDVLDDILGLIESVSEGFPTYSNWLIFVADLMKINCCEIFYIFLLIYEYVSECASI